MEGTMALLDENEVERRLSELDGWAREGKAIAKEYSCGDFAGSVEFVNRITPVAEDMNHHPDLAISWSTVTVTISTHSEGGVTAADFELASRIDALS
jgi:4a-hydroxytetrahydrobiopterin dehydratase